MEPRISNFTGVMMVSLAVFFDLSQILIEIVTLGLLGWLINPFISLFATLTFWFWFTIKGIKYAEPKNALALGVTTLIGYIPYLNDLPEWTSFVLTQISISRTEELVASISPELAGALSQTGSVKNNQTKQKTTINNNREEKKKNQDITPQESTPTRVGDETNNQNPTLEPTQAKTNQQKTQSNQQFGPMEVSPEEPGSVKMEQGGRYFDPFNVEDEEDLAA